MDATTDRVGVPQSSFAYDREATAQPAFATNMRDWLGGQDLARMVAKVVDGMENGNPRRKVLLGAITYSYASGVYDSEEIERALDEAQNPSLPETEAYAHGVRQYRRNHRIEIERCLADVLRRACGVGELSEHDFTREATERVNRAIRQDSWSLDF
jgi:hypothetical protein